MSAKGKPRQKSRTKAAVEEPRPIKVEPVRPAGQVPQATVSSRRGQVMIDRRGKGFSGHELDGAGISPRLAGGWGLSLDSRRRSSLEHNVDALKKWLATGEKPKRPTPEPTVAREEKTPTEKPAKKRAVRKKKAD